MVDIVGIWSIRLSLFFILRRLRNVIRGVSCTLYTLMILLVYSVNNGLAILRGGRTTNVLC